MCGCDIACNILPPCHANLAHHLSPFDSSSYHWPYKQTLLAVAVPYSSTLFSVVLAMVIHSASLLRLLRLAEAQCQLLIVLHL